MKGRRPILEVFFFWPLIMMFFTFLLRYKRLGFDGFALQDVQVAWRVILLNSFVGLSIAILLTYPKVRPHITQEVSFISAKKEPLWYFMHFGVSGFLVLNLVTQFMLHR